MNIMNSGTRFFLEGKVPDTKPLHSYFSFLPALSNRHYQENRQYLWAGTAIAINLIFWLLYIGANNFFKSYYLGAITVVLSLTSLCWIYTAIRCSTSHDYIKYSCTGFFLTPVITLLLFSPIKDIAFFIGLSSSAGAAIGVLIRDNIFKDNE